MAVWMHEYQVVVLMRAPVGLMLDMVDVPPGLFIDKKHLCCKSSGWRWIFLPGVAALDEAVQDREQLTQQRSELLWVFQRLVSVRRTFSYPRCNEPPIKPPCRARAARAPFPPA